MTSIMVIQSEMDSVDESSVALVISGILLPVNAAYTMEDYERPEII